MRLFLPRQQILDYLLEQKVSFGFAQVDVEEIVTVSGHLLETLTTVLAVPVFDEATLLGL